MKLPACLLCLVLGALAGARQTELVMWGLSLGPDSQGLQAVIREFERRNPDLRIKVLNLGAGHMNSQKLLTSVVGKVPPDIIHQGRFNISDYASRGAFLPLDDLLSRDRAQPDCPRPDQYYEAAWQEAMYDGRVYGIPTGADSRALYWNRKLFREKSAELRAAGLDPTRAPRTWSELLAYSRVLTQKRPDGSLDVAGFDPNFGNSWLYMYAFQNNASFISADGKRCTLQSPEAEEALQFMVDAYDILGGYKQAANFAMTFGANEQGPFITGKVAMMINGDWTVNGISRFGPSLDFGVAPPPVPDDRYHGRGRFAGEKDRFITWIGGFSYAIPTGARNVEEAWRFIKFASSFEARILFSQARAKFMRTLGRDFMPRIEAHIAANEELFRRYRPPDPKFAEALRMHFDLMEVARIRPPTIVGQLLWDEHVRVVEQAAIRLKTPKEALLDGQAIVQRDLDAFYGRERYRVLDLRIPALGAAGLIVLLGGVSFAGFRKARLGRLGRAEAKWGYLLVAPWAAGFLIFTLGPMLASLLFSFTDYDVLSPARWVGWQNYENLATLDRQNIGKALSNAAYLAGIGVPLGVATGLAVALLLNAAVRGMRFYRTCFYVPAIVPAVAATALWIWILNGDPSRGLVNALWRDTLQPWLGLTPPTWFGDEHWAKPALIFMGIWGAGSGMLLWLAGLKGIPSQLYEAASIDGATARHHFFAITFPQLSPVIFFNVVMGFIAALQEFDRTYVIGGGTAFGPNDSLLMPVNHVFRHGFTYFKMGHASALAWLIFAIVLALTLIQFRLGRRWVHYEAER